MFQAWKLIKQTIDEWWEDEAPRMGASLAYYALFSLAPLLVIVVAIIGFVYKGDTIGQIQRQVQSLVGADAARTIAEAIHNASAFDHGIAASVVSFVVLSLCATGCLQRTSHSDEQDLEGPATRMQLHSGCA